jgi:hypothetical protein
MEKLLMPSSRRVRSTFVLLAFAVTAICPTFGCGGGSADGTVVQVDPKFKTDTNDMLKQMSKDQMAKYKGKFKRR